MLRLAIIGTNWITDKFVEAALHTQEFELAAVYSRTAERAQQFANAYQVTEIFTSLEQLAASEDIDVVYVASPNSLHYSQTKQLLRAGKHVICEKPLTSNLRQTEELITIAKQHNVVLFEALKTVYLPNYSVIQTYLSKLGNLRKVLFNYCQYSSRYPKYLAGENPNTFNPAFSNGSLMDIGVYCLGTAVALWGAPLQVNASGMKLKSGVDGHGTVLMQYGDFDVTLMHSKVSDSHIASEIQGEAGSLIIDDISVCRKVIFQPRQGEAQIISQLQHDNEMIYEAKEFACLVSNQQVEHDGLSRALTTSALLTKIRDLIDVHYPADDEPLS